MLFVLFRSINCAIRYHLKPLHVIFFTGQDVYLGFPREIHSRHACINCSRREKSTLLICAPDFFCRVFPLLRQARCFYEILYKSNWKSFKPWHLFAVFAADRISAQTSMAQNSVFVWRLSCVSKTFSSCHYFWKFTADIWDLYGFSWKRAVVDAALSFRQMNVRHFILKLNCTLSRTISSFYV